MTCCALALVLCNFNPAENRHHPERHIKHQEPASTTRCQPKEPNFAHLRASPITNLRQRSITIPQRKFRGSSITPRVTLAHPPPSLQSRSPPIHSKYAGHLHGKEGLPGPFRRIDGGGSVPLRPVRAPRRVISSAPSAPEPAPAPAAAHPPGIRPRHRQARLPVGQAADAAHLQDRADRAGLRHHRCVRSCFCFVVVDGMDVMACRIMPDTTTRTWSGMFQRPRAFGMRLPVWLTCILHLHSTHVVV